MACCKLCACPCYLTFTMTYHRIKFSISFSSFFRFTFTFQLSFFLSFFLFLYIKNVIFLFSTFIISSSPPSPLFVQSTERNGLVNVFNICKLQRIYLSGLYHQMKQSRPGMLNAI